MVTTALTKEQVLGWLSEIADPEIPVVSIQEMGMLRDVNITGDACEVLLTPTYTGCPAMGIIEADIKALLHEKGVANATVKMIYQPAWTTDWMTDEAKEKMRRYGISPPVHSGCGDIFKAEQHVSCPKCGSEDTAVVSRFGSTACKALYKCNTCHEPFEYFKCH